VFSIGSISANDLPFELPAGKIKNISVTSSKKHPNHAFFDITIEEAYKEDRATILGATLPNFDQDNIIVISEGGKKEEVITADSKSNKTINYYSGLTIILDRIGLFNNKIKPKIDVDFIESIEFKDKAGSYLNPEFIYNNKDREIYSAEIIIKANTGILYQFLELDRTRTGLLNLKFAIVKIDKNSPQTIKTTAVVDITDVDTPAGSVIGITKEKDKRLLSELLAKKSDTFATVLYPLDYISPGSAVTIVNHKLSLLGKVSIDPDNPALLITDRCDYLISMVQALSLIDRPIPQVEIEVKILEVSWDKNERIGFDWAGVKSSDKSANHGSDFFSGALKTGLNAARKTSSGADLLIGRMEGENIKFLNAQMELLAKENKISLLASPRLKVVNNTKAEFHAGEQIPIFKISSQYDYEHIDDDRTFGADSKEINHGSYNSRNYNIDKTRSTTKSDDYLDIGVKLTVTPRITQASQIILELTPQVSEITGWREGTDRPIISTREITTTVKVSNNDTVLIAGLFKENETITNLGIPGLKEIPALGKLFKTEIKSNQKKEVIFLLKISTVK
jgi:hypothetical protein